MKTSIHFGLLSAFLVFALNQAKAQVESAADTLRLLEMSFDELMHVKIVSVSKKEENLFDAPLSASVLTREDIQRAGSTSIMEALRLVPGMIVREQSNGNYDIHLRGMDNVPQNAPFDVTSNTTTLVMIDNRPIYSYLRGGTFWETLPIDINDVERIEVVRGPAAALYGPNAVNGVINIITRQPQKDGLYILANSRLGSYHTIINNASLGYRFNKKLNMIASGNYQGRDRTQTSYFEFSRNKWLELPDYFLTFFGDTVTNGSTRYPNPSLAMEKYAGNVFLHYNPTEKIKFSLAAGAQHSMVQKVSTENEITPLSTATSNSRYADVHASMIGVSVRLSYNEGTQVTDYDPGNKYDFHIVDGNIEYNYTKGNLSIKPGLSYTTARYDDTHYLDEVNSKSIFKNTQAKINTQTASLRGEYKLFDEKLRLVAGGAVNKFNYPKTIYTAYQFAATYKIHKKHLLRAVYSRAPRSSTIFDTYVDQTVAYFPSGANTFTRVALMGNKDIKLLTATMFEIGYRGSITSGLNVDVELFNTRAKNFNTLVISRPFREVNGSDTLITAPYISVNLPLELQQQGLTVSLTYTSKKLQIKPFVTVQQTNMKNYAPSNVAPDSGAPGAEQNNIYSGMGTKKTLKSTPRAFGGASFNYSLNKKINININAYCYSTQTYYHLSNLIFNDGVRGIDHIHAKLIVNTNVTYEALKGLKLFCSVKNMLSDKSREFYRSDAMGRFLFAGVNFQFN